MNSRSSKRQGNLVPPKKKAALKKAVATGEKGKAFRQKKRKPVVEPPVQEPEPKKKPPRKKVKKASSKKSGKGSDDQPRWDQMSDEEFIEHTHKFFSGKRQGDVDE